jgi:hypothetical protein
MSDQPDLDIRRARYGEFGYRSINVGLAAGAIGFLTLLVRSIGRARDASFPLLLLAGVVSLFVLYGVFRMLLYGVFRLFDNSVKLSLTAKGLRDYRTGIFIRWTDFRGVRLESATMFVKVPHNDGEREVAVDVYGLERAPAEIVQCVRERGAATLQQQAAMKVIYELPGNVESGITADRPLD